MTTVKSLVAQAENASDQVANNINKGVELKFLMIDFIIDTVLKENKSKIATQLTILMGQLKIQAIGVHNKLNQYDEFEIPMNELHFVDKEIDTLCLLFQR